MLTGEAKFFASQHYREERCDDGTSTFLITGRKYDVTQDILSAIYHNDLDVTSLLDDGEGEA